MVFLPTSITLSARSFPLFLQVQDSTVAGDFENGCQTLSNATRLPTPLFTSCSKVSEAKRVMMARLSFLKAVQQREYVTASTSVVVKLKGQTVWTFSWTAVSPALQWNPTDPDQWVAFSAHDYDQCNSNCLILLSVGLLAGLYVTLLRSQSVTPNTTLWFNGRGGEGGVETNIVYNTKTLGSP